MPPVDPLRLWTATLGLMHLAVTLLAHLIYGAASTLRSNTTDLAETWSSHGRIWAREGALLGLGRRLRDRPPEPDPLRELQTGITKLKQELETLFNDGQEGSELVALAARCEELSRAPQLAWIELD